MSTLQLLRILAVASVLLASPALTGHADARDLYVNGQSGDDAAAATADAPLKTIARALQLVDAGDVIHLLPEGAVYREQISLVDISGFTIEGHGCTVSGADPLPSDPAAWENVGENLHRIQLDRTREDRHLLVVDGRGQFMGRTKFTIGRIGQLEQTEGWEAVKARLISQYPAPQDLNDGEFAWEPIDAKTGYLYVKGSLDNLEWTTRTQGVYTFGRVENVTIRNLHVRHVLNDGFNLHGAALNMRLVNVSGNECLDNGISPHGACSFDLEGGEFLRNGLAVGHGHLTRTRMADCVIGESLRQEYMAGGGEHVLEDAVVRGAYPELMRLVLFQVNPSTAYLVNEIRLAGRDPFEKVQPRYLLRRCEITGTGATPSAVVIGPGVAVTIEGCAFTHVDFQVDEAASVDVIDSTLDGEPLVMPPASSP